MLEMLIRLLSELIFLSGYIGSGGAFPKKLSPKEEGQYIAALKNGDMSARNALIEHNLRLVAHIVKKYSSESNADDMISVGIIGLIKGINTFNPEKNSKLSAYASRCIENEILMTLRSSKKLSNEISLEESLGVDGEGNSMTLADILPAENGDIIEDISRKTEIKQLYAAMKRVLKKSEYDILCSRYGLGGTRRRTQQEIADEAGISRSYVSRIEKAALNKLARELGQSSEPTVH